MEAVKKRPERRYDIDWLRSLAVLLLVFFHTARIFDSLSPFYIKNETLSALADNFILFIDLWHLPLLFFVAGIASWFSLEFRTQNRYLKERLKRLVIPFVFGVLVIVPPQLFFVSKANFGFSGSYLQFLSSYFFDFNPRYPFGGDYSGTFEIAHLWFLIILFIFSLFALPPFLYFKRLKGRSLIFKVGNFVEKKGLALLFAIPLVFIEVIFRALRGWSFLQNPIFYFGFFFYGFFIFADKRFPKFLSRDRKMLLTLAILGTLILFFMINTGWGFNPSDSFSSPDNDLFKRIIFQALRGLTIWVWVFAFLSLGMKYLNFNNRFLKYATEAALPFYVLHQTVIVIIGFYVIQLSMSVLAKYFLITIASLILTLAIYDLFVRRTNITRFLFGMRLLGKK